MPSRRAYRLGCLALAIAAGSAAAGEWIGGSGNWNDPANWAAGVVPGAGEGALVNNGGTVLATDLIIEAGTGGFGGLVGDQSGDGHFVQSGGSSSWGGLGLAFGNFAGTSGSLILTDAGAMTTIRLGFGNRGAGSGRIDAGSTVNTSRLFVAGLSRTPSREFTSAGDLTIDGPGTRVSVAGSGDGFSAGYDGAASVTVSGGALLEVARGLLVSTVADGSSMTIEGPGSTLRFGGGADAWFDLGRDITLPPDHGPVGQAVLTLRDGGRVEQTGVGRGMVLAERSLVRGSGELDTTITNLQGSIIDPGEDDAFGHLHIARLLDNNATPYVGVDGGTLRFDLGGTVDGMYDQLTVGALLAGGTLEIALADGFAAAFGDAFQIITITDQALFAGGQPVGSFDTVVLPDLTGGLFFEVDLADSGVSLRVVPAPGAAGLGLAACIVFARRPLRAQPTRSDNR